MFTIAFKYSLVLPANCLQKGSIMHSSATLIVTILLQSSTEYTLRNGKTGGWCLLLMGGICLYNM